jgi:hypothetical protein
MDKMNSGQSLGEMSKFLCKSFETGISGRPERVRHEEDLGTNELR